METTLAERFTCIRSYTEALCQPLSTEDYVPQAVEFTSPPKWHLAHTSWFFETMVLQKFHATYRVFGESYNFLFNSYYQTIGARAIRAQRGIITRPTVEQVYAYRRHVDNAILELLANTQDPQVIELLILGLNHEQQHQELLLTDLKYTLSLNPTFPVYDANKNLLASSNSQSGWQTIDAGNYSIGHQGEGFCFDNELGHHTVHIPTFAIQRALVSNGEYLEFIEQGGYQNFEYWLDEGWSWVQANRITAPLYWHKKDNIWHQFTLAGLQAIQAEHILAHVSFYEADAFARWKGYRLPTEFEWEIASAQFDWGQRWEWTQSAYSPYPNFTVRKGAVGEYNGKFMINQMVLRGASVATSPQHSRNTYRNFFHPHMQWQYSGIRLAK